MEPKKPMSKRDLERQLDALTNMSLNLVDDSQKIKENQVIKDFRNMKKSDLVGMQSGQVQILILKVLKALVWEDYEK